MSEILVLLTSENCFVKPNRAGDNKKVSRTMLLEQETKKLALKFQT